MQQFILNDDDCVRNDFINFIFKQVIMTMKIIYAITIQFYKYVFVNFSEKL